MATLTASTYAQLATNISSSASGDTIQLQNDINVDREYPQGVATIDLSSGTAKTITITGAHAPHFEQNKYYSESNNTYTLLQSEPQNWATNYSDYFILEDDAYIPVEADNYKILNLRNAVGATSWLTSNGILNFDHIDFQNLILNGCHWVTLDSNGEELHVHNCRFTGSRSGESYLFNVAHGKIVDLISCAFDVPWQGMGAAATDAALAWTSLAPKFTNTETFTGSFTADYCRFHEHYTGWSVSTETVPDPKVRTYSCDSFVLNGCYIYGDMTVPFSTSSGTWQYCIMNYLNPLCLASINPQKAQNVFDVEVNAKYTGSSTISTVKASYNNFFGIMTKHFKLDDKGTIRQAETIIKGRAYDNTKAFPIFVTDAEFADDEELFKKGFDIIVPVEE